MYRPEAGRGATTTSVSKTVARSERKKSGEAGLTYGLQVPHLGARSSRELRTHAAQMFVPPFVTGSKASQGLSSSSLTKASNLPDQSGALYAHMRSLEPALSFVGRAFAGGVALPGRVARSGRFLSMGLVLVSELTDKSGTENAAAWGKGGGLGKTVDDIQWGAGGCLYSCCTQLRSQQRWRCASLLCEADLLEGVQEVKAAS